jgi:hypothetical protein
LITLGPGCALFNVQTVLRPFCTSFAHQTCPPFPSIKCAIFIWLLFRRNLVLNVRHSDTLKYNAPFVHQVCPMNYCTAEFCRVKFTKVQNFVILFLVWHFTNAFSESQPVFVKEKIWDSRTHSCNWGIIKQIIWHKLEKNWD